MVENFVLKQEERRVIRRAIVMENKKCKQELRRVLTKVEFPHARQSNMDEHAIQVPGLGTEEAHEWET